MKVFKRIIVLLLTAIMIAATSFTTYAANAGWQKSGSAWYYNNGSGNHVTGWQKIGGVWYYFTSSGIMTTGWQKIGGVWYYMSSSGAMLTGWVKDRGYWYYMSSSGAMTTGWQKVGNVWYYMNASGAMTTGWQKVGGIWYYMNPSGAMQTGWVKVDGIWYYMNASGAMQTGWQKVGGIWYYMNPSGEMQTGWVQDGDIRYYMNASGAMQTGWQVIGGNWYYFEASGAMHIGWLKEGGYWYFLKDNGIMAVDETIGEDRFDEHGHLVIAVLPTDELTRENILAFLDVYDPDGAYIIRNTSEEALRFWFGSDSTIGDAVRSESFDTAVHEQCHEYTHISTSWSFNSYTGKYMDSAERIYIGGGKSMQVTMTPVFDSIEMVPTIPEELQTSRFTTYINTDEDSMSSRQEGVYGILNEFTAYCWGMNNDLQLYDYKIENGLSPGYYTNTYMAYAEFRYYSLQYILYAKTNYPEVYNDIIQNESYRTAFTIIDNKFKSVVEAWSKDNWLPWYSDYEALMNKMQEKEYTDIVALLVP